MGKDVNARTLKCGKWANVLSLEPDVGQIDNRLVVQSSPALSSSEKSRQQPLVSIFAWPMDN